jgi:hypothetical protein
VLTGLFKVHWTHGKKPPPHAHVAVQYNGFWFYIDERDRDTKATFTKGGNAPILTLPLGGR